MNDWRELKGIMKALADVARLTMVYHLARRAEVTVTELTDLLKISQPLVSWHLRRLKRVGLVSTRRTGRQVYCSLNRQRFQLYQHWLDSLLDPRVELEALPSGEALAEVDLAIEE
jgi:ArsR family transcriptional regulator, arsenate/arsenite/antimonite-responsive transcriptional repressor